MQNQSIVHDHQMTHNSLAEACSLHGCGVSWSAIFAGSAAAAALSLILLILGFGLGFSAISPWANDGISAKALGISTIAWLIFTQLASSGLGGYLAGRLRVKWASLHSDEVYFRDTAHGFLSWAISTIITAAFLGSAIGGIVSGGAQAGAAALSGLSNAAMKAAPGMSNMMDDQHGALGYYVDSLLRGDATAGNAAAGNVTGNDAATNNGAQGSMSANGMQGNMFADRTAQMETMRVFMHALRNSGNGGNGELAPQDRQYLAQQLAKRTGQNPADAERRVDEIYTQFKKSANDAAVAAREAADKARKAAAYSALWMFVALLCGAFFASICATFGGTQRDRAIYHSNAKL